MPAGRKENIKVKWSVLCMTEFVMNAQGGTLYHGLYGVVPPKRGALFRLQAYERVRISLNLKSVIR